MRPPSTFSVSPGVQGLRTLLVNLYFVGGAEQGGWVLVDAGLRGFGHRIRAEALRRFGSVPPRAVLLTHGHFDHVGALPSLLQQWNVPVFAHRNELPFLNAHHPYPSPDPSVGGGILARSSAVFPRHAPRFRRVVEPLPTDGTIPFLPGWRWIATPGHSRGHVSYWRESDGTLLAGDALITTRQESALAVWQQTKEVRPPPAYFTTDWTAALASMQRLRALRASVLASGHGQPMAGEGWRRELDRLLADFPHRGLPDHGRYVRASCGHPARS